VATVTALVVMALLPLFGFVAWRVYVAAASPAE
jgi:hypothetical protein